MNKKNIIAVTLTLIVSILLLLLWFYLGFHHVDAPLDFIVSIIWWCCVAALIFGVVRAEKKRREALRTIYVGKAMIFNPEKGLVHVGTTPVLTAAAEMLSELEYGFRTEELPGHFRLNMDFVIHTEKYADEGQTWEGKVIRLDTPDEYIAFSNRFDLSAIISGQISSACDTLEECQNLPSHIIYAPC